MTPTLIWLWIKAKFAEYLYIGIAMVVVAGIAFWQGWNFRAERCDAAQARAQIATKTEDIKITDSAADDDRRIAGEIEESDVKLQDKVDEYAKGFENGKADSCNLTDDDVRGLLRVQ